MQTAQQHGTIDKVLFRFFIFWYSVGLILLVFDILPPALEWANSVFLIACGVLGGFYFYRTYGNFGAIFTLFVLFGSIVAESIGVKTGLIFGQYNYSDQLGLQWLGVPIAIGFAWVMIIAVSHAIAGGIVKPFKGQTAIKIPLYVVTGGLIAVVMDGIIDPVAYLVKGYWFWDGSGIYYGIPLQNFVGWFLLASFFHITLVTGLNITKKTATTQHPYWHSRTIAVFMMVTSMFVVLGLTSELYLASIGVTLASIILLSLYRINNKPLSLNRNIAYSPGKR
ncbi:carotenoid biosynthesis protein [Fictibacillus phosphorivorans]|uniref:carotenoid biosynthesis protein n=1 Tax=Fictibacillus phosphorivorans TaxID=1221500 RepID=UPI001642BBD0|nr:carotenoid biosynthesis protein [Fictibacillus phosphorivorans]